MSNEQQHTAADLSVAKSLKADIQFHTWLTTRQQAEAPGHKSKRASILVSHILKGEKEMARAIIEETPSLLLIRAKATDYSGRTVYATGLQAALAALDIDMANMIEPYLLALDEGEALLQQQIATQFPQAMRATPAYDFSGLVKAIDMNQGEIVELALKKFRVEMTPNDVIASGMHFNTAHLIKAYEVYRDHFPTWDKTQRSTFWINVIGFLQRQMPAALAQAYCNGLYQLAFTDKSLERHFNLYGEETFYPLSLETHSGLGFKYAIAANRDGGMQTDSRGRRGRPPVNELSALKAYLEKLYLKLEEFKSKQIETRLDFNAI